MGEITECDINNTEFHFQNFLLVLFFVFHFLCWCWPTDFVFLFQEATGSIHFNSIMPRSQIDSLNLFTFLFEYFIWSLVLFESESLNYFSEILTQKKGETMELDLERYLSHIAYCICSVLFILWIHSICNFHFFLTYFISFLIVL